MAAAAAVAALLAAGTPAGAEDGKGAYLAAWSLSGGVGYAVPSTDEYADAFAGRLAVGYSPWPSLEIDLEVGGWSAQVSQPDPGGIPSHTVASGRLKVRPLTLTAQWRHPVPGLLATAYLLAGAGWYLIDYDMADEPRAVYEGSGTVGLPDQGVDNALGWHLGAGLEYPVTERLSLTAEGRYVFLSPDAHGATTPGYRIAGSLDLDTLLFFAGVKVTY